MIRLPSNLIGRDIDLGTVEIVPDDIRRYARDVGDDALAGGPCTVAPLGMALALRGGPLPEAPLDGDTVAVHGGHSITVLGPFTAPARYAVRARITDVFEKSGRSGRLTVIVRRAEISAADGTARVVVEDQQIVRRQTPVSPPHEPLSGRVHDDPRPREAIAVLHSLEIGTMIGPLHCTAPAAASIAQYAHAVRAPEPLFIDANFAHSLGYADVIVPGPLQSALVERLLRQCLSSWSLRRLSLSFRQAVIAGEPIAMAAEVTELQRDADGERLVADLWIENRHGERAALGVAALRRQPHPA